MQLRPILLVEDSENDVALTLAVFEEAQLANEVIVVRDGQEGLRRAGWSVERLATWGKGQVGVGWRRRNLQASLAVAQREIGDLGVKIDDTLGGFTLSWRPQDETP